MPEESPVATTNDTLTLDSAQSKRDYIPKVLPVFKSGAYVDAKRKEDNNWYPGLISSVQCTVVNSAGKNEESPRGRKKIVTYQSYNMSHINIIQLVYSNLLNPYSISEQFFINSIDTYK